MLLLCSPVHLHHQYSRVKAIECRRVTSAELYAMIVEHKVSSSDSLLVKSDCVEEMGSELWNHDGGGGNRNAPKAIVPPRAWEGLCKACSLRTLGVLVWLMP